MKNSGIDLLRTPHPGGGNARRHCVVEIVIVRTTALTTNNRAEN
jgi:hypothetical protein